MEGYGFTSFRKDLVAGIIVGILAGPLAIAFAIASGARPDQGITAAIIGGLIAALTSGSKYQITGPSGAFVILILSTSLQYGYEGMLMATLMAGILLIIAGFAKVGNMIRFIPYSVTVGFTAGIAVLIITSQATYFLGIPLSLGNKTFFLKWYTIASHITEINWIEFLLGTLSILIVRLWPKLKTPFPGSLVTIIVAGGLVKIFSLPSLTIGDTFGNLAFSLPSFKIPPFEWMNLPSLIEPAVAIALLISIESLLSAMVADGMTGRKHRTHMELISQGLANIGSSLAGGLPATGAIARTATNIKSGAVSPVSGVIHAIVVLITMLFLGNWISSIPLATLAGILFVIAFNMGEWNYFLTIFRSPKGDVVILLTTFLSTLFVNLVFAIETGVILAAFIHLNRLAEASGMEEMSPAEELDEDPEEIQRMQSLKIPPEVEVYEIYGSLFLRRNGEVYDSSS